MPERRRRQVPWPYAIERRRVHGRPVVSLLRHGEQVAWLNPSTAIAVADRLVDAAERIELGRDEK